LKGDGLPEIGAVGKFYTACALADAVVTLSFIRVASQEANPIVRSLMENLGLIGGVAMFFGITLLSFWLMVSITKRKSVNVANGLLILGIGILALTVGHKGWILVLVWLPLAVLDKLGGDSSRRPLAELPAVGYALWLGGCTFGEPARGYSETPAELIAPRAKLF